jgi:hypothetical protein
VRRQIVAQQEEYDDEELGPARRGRPKAPEPSATRRMLLLDENARATYKSRAHSTPAAGWAGLANGASAEGVPFACGKPSLATTFTSVLGMPAGAYSSSLARFVAGCSSKVQQLVLHRLVQTVPVHNPKAEAAAAAAALAAAPSAAAGAPVSAAPAGAAVRPVVVDLTGEQRAGGQQAPKAQPQLVYNPQQAAAQQQAQQQLLQAQQQQAQLLRARHVAAAGGQQLGQQAAGSASVPISLLRQVPGQGQVLLQAGNLAGLGGTLVNTSQGIMRAISLNGQTVLVPAGANFQNLQQQQQQQQALQLLAAQAQQQQQQGLLQLQQQQQQNVLLPGGMLAGLSQQQLLALGRQQTPGQQ